MYKRLIVVLISIAILAATFLSGYVFSKKESLIISMLFRQDVSNTDAEKIEIDGQLSLFRKSNKFNQPLLIKLHSWSSDYTQDDPLSNFVMEEDWNYIQPDFQGPNNHPNACGSKLVIENIDAAIEYAIDQGNVDTDKIFVVGESGGGYATLITFMHSKHKINSYLSWVPITDLESWYYESLSRNQVYANDILLCTESDGELNIEKARNRSPLYMETPVDKLNESNLFIFAGIHDGYSGSVPITHSINFYNKIAIETGNEIVSHEDVIKLLRKDVRKSLNKIEEREVYLQKSFGNTSLTIFDGGHETLVEYTEDVLKSLSQ